MLYLYLSFSIIPHGYNFSLVSRHTFCWRNWAVRYLVKIQNSVIPKFRKSLSRTTSLIFLNFSKKTKTTVQEEKEKKKKIWSRWDWTTLTRTFVPCPRFFNCIFRWKFKVDFFVQIELDGLVQFLCRGIESLAGGTGETALAFDVLAFALEDWGYKNYDNDINYPLVLSVIIIELSFNPLSPPLFSNHFSLLWFPRWKK